MWLEGEAFQGRAGRGGAGEVGVFVVVMNLESFKPQIIPIKQTR